MVKMLLFIALGGSMGAVARYLVIVGVGNTLGMHFPYGTLVVNVLGSFVLGMLVEIMALKWNVTQEVRALLVLGVLGGFTTFSTFSLDVVLQLERGQLWPAITYVVSSVVLSIAALFLGLRLMRLVLA